MQYRVLGQLCVRYAAHYFWYTVLYRCYRDIIEPKHTVLLISI